MKKDLDRVDAKEAVFAENVKADGHAGGAGNVVENEGQMRRFNHGVPVIHDAVIRLGEVVGRH